MESLRPLDVLNKNKGKEILVELKNSTIYKGKLETFDIHLNLVLSDSTEIKDKNEQNSGTILIRGDTITIIKNL